jgi:hypothetical protein
MNNLKSLILIVAIAALFSSCAKDGATGATGLTGATGVTGATGNGNVYAISVPVTFWNDSTTYWCANIQDPYMTDTVQSSGAVQVFVSTDNAFSWLALPTTFISSPQNYLMNYSTQTGSIEITWQESNGQIGTSPGIFFGVTCQFKVVVIPSALRKRNVSSNNISTH